MKIGSFVLTRESAIFLWVKIVGVATLITSGLIDLKPLGLPDAWQHKIVAVAALITALAAYLSKSPLPGKADA